MKAPFLFSPLYLRSMVVTNLVAVVLGIYNAVHHPADLGWYLGWATVSTVLGLWFVYVSWYYDDVMRQRVITIGSWFADAFIMLVFLFGFACVCVADWWNNLGDSDEKKDDQP